jgi:CBS domain-containing protein
MRTEPFRTEIRRIRKNIHHAFHDRMHSQGPTQTAWHRIDEERQLRPRLTIYDTMQKCPISVRPESPLPHALALMIENEISGLPVVDAEGRIVDYEGVFDLSKVVAAYQRVASKA